MPYKLSQRARLFLERATKAEYKTLWTLFAAGLIIRIALILVIGHYDHNPAVWENGTIAENIYSGKGFIFGISYSKTHVFPEAPTSYQQPFYPYFLAFIYSFFGITSTAYLVVSLLQAVATALVPIVVFKLAKQLFDEKVALVTVLLLTVYPLLLWYPTRIHHTSFTFLAVAYVVLFLVESKAQPSSWRLAKTGLALGIGLLIEPTLLTIFIGFVAWHWLNERDWTLVKHSFAIFAVAVLVVLPWTIRNYTVYGKFVFIKSSFEKNFLQGNNPYATGTAVAEGGQDESLVAMPDEFWKKLEGKTEIEINNVLWNEAMTWIEENPIQFATLTAKRLVWFWWYAPDSAMRQTKEAESVKYSWLKRLYWLPMLLLMLLGTIIALREKNQATWLIWSVGAFYSLTYIVTTVGQQRFRGVIEPLFVVIVGYAFVKLIDLFLPEPKTKLQNA